MKMKWMTGVAASALLTVVGCMHSGSETKSDTTAAQSAASHEFQKAADAQKAATDQEQKAEQADQEVAAAQKALAESQAKAQGQRLKAEQAQASAKQLAEEASQQGLQQQQEASTAMKRETAQVRQKEEQREGWRAEKKISGKVIEASDSNLRVRSQTKGDVDLSLNDSTALQVDGAPAKADQIKPGDEVRASYHDVEGKATAVRIDVLKPDLNNTDTSTTSTPQK